MLTTKVCSRKIGRAHGMGLLACALLMVGCARSNITTTVQPNGSWTRQIAYHTTAPDDKGGPNLAPNLADIFEIPNGPNWKAAETKKENEIITTVTRSMQAGASLQHDVVVKAGKEAKNPSLVNLVTVREIAPGKLEYTETLRWKGKQPTQFTTLDPEAQAAIKAALPPRLATEENVKATTQVVTKEFLRAILGPGEPMLPQLFGQMLMSPELGERLILRRVGKVISKGLETQFGAQMTPQERIEVTRKLITSAFNSTQGKVKSKASPEAALGGPDKSKDEGALVVLTFVVKMPGKVIETNGETDEFSNEVYWALYPEAAAMGDVVLRAICEVGK